VSAGEEVSRVLHLSNVIVSESLLHFPELLIDCRGCEEDWAHSNEVVLATKPAIVCPGIPANLFALLLHVAPVFCILTADSDHVITFKSEVCCSSDII
jgi:hypothetical protein